MLRKLLMIHCIAFLAHPAAFAATIPPGPARHRFGVLLVGESGSPQGERAARVVQKRVARWLENMPGESEVEPLSHSLELDSWTKARSRDALSARVSAVVASLVAQEAPESLLDRLPPLEEEAGALSHSPELQRLWLVKAFALWRQKKEPAARAVLKKALALHPHGAYPDIFPAQWDWSETLGFDEAVQAVQTGLRRVCTYHLSAPQSLARGSLNGFTIAVPTVLHLVPGQAYELRLSAPGFQDAVRTLGCERQSESQIAIAMSRSAVAASASALLDISQRHSLDSVFLIEQGLDEFHFYLYSRGGAVVEVPLVSPLRVAELSQGQGRESLPILTDAFVALLEKQRVAQLALGDGVPAQVTRGLTQANAAPTRWYNNWKFWAIAGTIAGGAVIAYFATRGDGNEVKTQSGFSVRLE